MVLEIVVHPSPRSHDTWIKPLSFCTSPCLMSLAFVAVGSQTWVFVQLQDCYIEVHVFLYIYLIDIAKLLCRKTTTNYISTRCVRVFLPTSLLVRCYHVQTFTLLIVTFFHFPHYRWDWTSFYTSDGHLGGCVLWIT